MQKLNIVIKIENCTIAIVGSIRRGRTTIFVSHNGDEYQNCDVASPGAQCAKYKQMFWRKNPMHCRSVQDVRRDKLMIIGECLNEIHAKKD